MPNAPSIPEPGTPRAARLAWVIALLLLAVTVWLQQSGTAARPAPRPGAGPQATAPTIAPPGADGLMIAARVVLRVRGNAVAVEMLRPMLEREANTPLDRLRLAVILNEIDAKGVAGLDLLKRAAAELATDPGPEARLLAADARALQSLYAAETADGLSAEERGALTEHHGFYGRLALAFGKPATDPARIGLIDDALWPLLLMSLLALIGFIAFFVGLVLLIYFVQRARSGLLPARHAPPAAGGSLGVELLAVFIAGFLMVKAAGALAAGASPHAAAWVSLGAQWLLLPLVLIYPRLRAGGGASARAFLGLRTASSTRLSEAWAGFVGWLCCVPLLVLGAIVSVVLSALWSKVSRPGQPGEAPTNPVVEMLSGAGGPWIIVMIFALAAVWAPIVEETVFRGGVYGHLRGRWPVLGAAAVSALIFAVMHGYAILMLGPVIALGLGFALIRHYRGSLAASMTAHCIHNSLIMIFLLLAIRVLGL